MLNLVDRNVIFSVKPEYAEKIVTGEKNVELRRRFASEAVIGAVAFIYSTSPVRAIVGYARIADVRRTSVSEIWKAYGERACISRAAFERYFQGTDQGYAIILEDPVSLPQISVNDLERRFGFHPPQSYGYADEAYQELIA